MRLLCGCIPFSHFKHCLSYFGRCFFFSLKYTVFIFASFSASTVIYPLAFSSLYLAGDMPKWALTYLPKNDWLGNSK